MADTVSVCGAVPDAGVTDSHGASSDAVKESVPPPVFVTLSVLVAGLAPPAVAENDRLAGDTEIAGAAATVRVTGICFGEPWVPAEVTVTVPEYVPAARPVVSTDTLRSRGAVPLVGLTDSHGASSETVKESEPPPVLATLSVLAAGLAAPAVALNARLDGATASTAGCAAPPAAAP